MNETELTEDLDNRGLLSDARNPGVYALKADVPDNSTVVMHQWDEEYDVRPNEPTLTRLAQAEQVAYVGASKNVYDRLTDHAAGDVRTTAFLGVFSPEEVLDIWPCANPFEKEYRRALRLANQGWLCWTDGEVVG